VEARGLPPLPPTEYLFPYTPLARLHTDSKSIFGF